MYGFAILSSINYRQTMKFAVKYHQLATPLVTMEFKENDGCGIWLLNSKASMSRAGRRSPTGLVATAANDDGASRGVRI
jgi:hypothetical protein